MSVWPEDGGLLLFDVPSTKHEVIVQFEVNGAEAFGYGT